MRQHHRQRRALGALVLLAALIVHQGVAHSLTNTEESVRYWASAYGLDPDYMWRVALCESSGNPQAQNGDHYGLFQFLPETYLEQRDLLNQDPRLAPHLAVFDPESRAMLDDAGDAEAHVAVHAFYMGYGPVLWQCA